MSLLDPRIYYSSIGFMEEITVVIFNKSGNIQEWVEIEFPLPS